MCAHAQLQFLIVLLNIFIFLVTSVVGCPPIILHPLVLFPSHLFVPKGLT